jgi:hypothetical protein
MKKILLPFLPALLLLGCGQASTGNAGSTDSTQTNAGSSKNNAVTVTAANFNRAETDMYFAETVKLAGGLGQFHHYRELMPVEHQTVIRTNRDVLYSSIVFDLDAGPATVTLPDPGKRFMSLMSIDEDQYSQTYYAPGSFTFSKDKIGTRYVMIAIRTLVDPNDPKDLDKVKALQDAIKVVQQDKGKFEISNWDSISRKSMHDSLAAASKTLPDSKRMFGNKDEVDPARHLIGTAVGWGGNAEKDAIYTSIIPAKNDGTTVYRLKVKNVPVDGFWSVCVYNQQGYFQQNDLNSYSLNSITAKKDADGSITIQFGGCDGKAANCIPTMQGWNYCVRLYRPRKEILDGSWKFPEAQAVK